MEDDELAALWIAGCYLCRQGLSCFYVSSYSTPEEIQAEFAGPSSGVCTAESSPYRPGWARNESPASCIQLRSRRIQLSTWTGRNRTADFGL